MVQETMTPRQRWLGALDMQPIDRLPFWPKIEGAYCAARTGRFGGMDVPALHEFIGAEPQGWAGEIVREVRTSTTVERSRDNGTLRTVFRSPRGQTEQVYQWDPGSHSWHPVVFPARDRESLGVLIDCYRDGGAELDRDALEQARSQGRAHGERGAVAGNIGESPLMHWVEHLAGVENAHYFLADWPDLVEELFEAMHADLLRRTAIYAEHHPADFIYLTENTSTTLISPDQYRRYCSRHIGEYGRIMRQAGRRLVLHMCGKLRGLLDQLAEVPAAGFEAFTSPTVGDTRLIDGRTACPSICLIGGTNAWLWTRPAEQIIAELQRDLDALAHHRGLVVTSAGVMPPAAEPETIRRVCQWVHDYPARM